MRHGFYGRTLVSKMAKSTENKRPAKAAPTPRRPKRPNVRFEATVNNGHVDLHATAPTKWFRVLLRVLVIIVIAIVILKMPELWQAIQAAIHLVPK
jgi:hypothetical protein